MFRRLNHAWIRVLLFYLIAISASFVFRTLQLRVPYCGSIDGDWFAAGGVFCGALLVTRLFKVKRQTSLLGSSRWLSLLMPGAALAFYFVIGANAGDFWRRHATGLGLGIYIICYCILEETGWRGYLQDELRGLHFAIRYSLVGLAWYAWHLNLLDPHVDLLFLVILMTASLGFGFAVECTRSVMVGACFHSIGNLVAFSTLIRANMDGRSRLALAGLCIAAWVPILIHWDSKPTQGVTAPLVPEREKAPPEPPTDAHGLADPGDPTRHR